MFKTIFKSMAVLSVLVVVGCASQPRISAQSRDGADFTQYRTYGWVSPLATDNAGYSTIITSHFKAAVQQEMQARGYVFSATDPDLQVNFFSNVENRSETRSSPSMSIGYFGYRGRFGYGMNIPVYNNQVETRNYKVGTVSIDVVDARRKELIWSGVLEGALSNKAMENPAGAIRSAVSQIYSRYPVALPAAAQAQ
jgi:Domain of unknown function (DUF4136)